MTWLAAMGRAVAALPAAAEVAAKCFPVRGPAQAAEIRSHDHSAARASRTATLIAFWAVRRASSAFCMSSSTAVVMAQTVPQNMAQPGSASGNWRRHRSW